MIAISTLGFIALLILGLVLLCGGAMVSFAAGQASSGGHERTANRGCLGALIGLAAFVCAIVGLFGGFA